MIKYNPAFTPEIANYLNGHPAIGTETVGCFDYKLWYFKDFQAVMDRACKDKKHPFHKIISAILQGRRKPLKFTIENAREFLKWIEPKWCECHKVKSSGFFEKEEAQHD